MTEYLDRYPTMHEYAEGKRINPKLTDLISRADAIEAVRNEIQDFEANYMHGEDDENYGHDIGFVAGLHRAKTFIRSLPSAEADWIPCSDRLPSESGDYFCTIPLNACETYTEVLTFYKGKFYEDDAGECGALYHDDVLAWMPLPEPYREDGEEE